MPSSIVPCLRYRDAEAAIHFLCHAFGFQEHAVNRNEAHPARIDHVELTYGDGMVMLGSVDNDSPFGSRMVQPEAVGGRQTQCVWVAVADVRAHYTRAKAGGAIIVDDYEDKPFGGAGYSARDPEGHLWYFGDYDPWGRAG